MLFVDAIIHRREFIENDNIFAELKTILGLRRNIT
jgi:hypothetical protein